MNNQNHMETINQELERKEFAYYIGCIKIPLLDKKDVDESLSRITSIIEEEIKRLLSIEGCVDEVPNAILIGQVIAYQKVLDLI